VQLAQSRGLSLRETLQQTSYLEWQLWEIARRNNLVAEPWLQTGWLIHNIEAFMSEKPRPLAKCLPQRAAELDEKQKAVRIKYEMHKVSGEHNGVLTAWKPGR